MITKLLERGGDLAERAQVCVIGSGAGGAVVAAEIASAGHDVVVLEQGHYWTKADFTQREDQMLPRLFEEAGMRQTSDGSITILQGRNVGGSTVHNLCYCFRTPDPILAMWQREHALPGLTPEAMRPSFERVERMLKVKPIRESEVQAFIMRRFDIAPDGFPIGFEDMCSLQALGTAQKYTGSYERVARSIRDFVSGDKLMESREQFFATLVLSMMVRNGDAHLKNFGVLYSSPLDAVSIAPVYDVVTTTAYIKKDVPALSLAGTKKWWPRKVLDRFAIVHLSLQPSTVDDIFSRMSAAVMETRGIIPDYIADHPEFREVGKLMMAAWEEGVIGLNG